MNRLASASDCIKLWQSSSDTPIKTFNPHTASPASPSPSSTTQTSRVNSVRWNHNNQVLASVGDDGQIKLSHSSGVVLGSFGAATEGGAGKEELYAVGFSSGSRYLASGGSACKVNVYDLRKKVKLREMGNHRNSVSCVGFSDKDTHIAAGDLHGDILLYSMANPASIAFLSCSQDTVKPQQPQAVKALEFSPFKKHILSSCGDDGYVRTWDVNTKQLVHRVEQGDVTPQHRAPATDLCFSPFNHLLLGSCGLDKRALFVDIAEQKAVKVIKCVHPLTCMSFMDDGITVALGSSKGVIYVYDLRSSSMPVKEYKAHSPLPVLSLSFQSSTDKSGAQAPREKVTIPLTTAQKKIQEGEKLRNANSVSGMGDNVLSPLKKEIEYVEAVSTASTVKSATAHSTPSAGNRGMYHSGIFTPMAAASASLSGLEVETPSAGRNGSLLNTPRLDSPAITSSVSAVESHTLSRVDAAMTPSGPGTYSVLKDVGNVTPFSSLLASSDGPSASEVGNTLQTNASSHPQATALPNAHSTLAPASVNSSSSSSTLNPARSLLLENTKSRYEKEQTNTKNAFPSRPVPTKITDVHSNVVTNRVSGKENNTGNHPNIMHSSSSISKGKPSLTHANKNSEVLTSSSQQEGRGHPAANPLGVSMGGEAGVSSEFQAEFLKGVVGDCLDDFRTSVHRDIQSMHLEMLRQFEIQKNDIAQLLEFYSVNEALVKEIEMLKEENRRLKLNMR
eukprot:Nk52_evm55s266 gene=Nk52_evmTU55s266